MAGARVENIFPKRFSPEKKFFSQPLPSQDTHETLHMQYPAYFPGDIKPGGYSPDFLRRDGNIAIASLQNYY
jgi:hypothetical protein